MTSDTVLICCIENSNQQQNPNLLNSREKHQTIGKPFCTNLGLIPVWEDTNLAFGTVIILTLQAFMVNRQSDVNPPSRSARAKNQRGNFTHPADSAVLLLITGCGSSLSSPALRRKAVITSLTGAWAQLQRETVIDEKRDGKKKNNGRSERVLDTTFAVTLFCLTGLKLTKRISYTGRAEMRTRFSFWRVPVSVRFQGLQQHKHAFWFIVLNIDSLGKQLATWSAPLYPTHAFPSSTHHHGPHSML